MTEPKWSMSIIAKDEEQSLPKLLDSCQEFITRGGQIVVVDTGSTDKTIQVLCDRGFKSYTTDPEAQLIYDEVGTKFLSEVDPGVAKQANQRFRSGPGENLVEVGRKVFNFGAAREYAAKLCKQDWALCPDCDEVFTHLDIDFLNRIIETNDVDQITFTFRYCNPDGTPSNVTARDKFYNRQKGEWKWIVHESVVSRTAERLRQTVLAPNVLLLDHFQHPAEHRSGYLTQMCIDVLEDDSNEHHLFWLGREMGSHNQNWACIHTLTEYLLRFPNGWGAERCMACCFIAKAYLRLSDSTELFKIDKLGNLIYIPDVSDMGRNMLENLGVIKDLEDQKKFFTRNAIGWFSKGIHYETAFREPWVYLADLYMKLDKKQEALQYAKAALKIQNIPQTYLNDQWCYGSHIYYICLWAYWWTKQPKRSFKYWKKAIAMDPHNALFKQFEPFYEDYM